MPNEQWGEQEWVEEPIIMVKEVASPKLGDCPETILYDSTGEEPCNIPVHQHCKDGRCYHHHNQMCRVGRTTKGCSIDRLTPKR